MCSIKTSEKAVKFGNVVINKKEFHVSIKPIALNFVDIEKIVVSDKSKYSGKGSKYFIGCTDDNIIRPLCIILPQMRYLTFMYYFTSNEWIHKIFS